MIKQTIRYRLLLLTLIPPILMLLIIVSYFVYQDDKLMREALFDRGSSLSRYLSSVAEYGVITGNTQQLQHISDTLLQDDIVAMTIYDFDGRTILSAGKEPLALQVGANMESAGYCGGDDSRLMFCAPIKLDVMPVSDFESSNASSESTTIGRVELTLSTYLIEEKRQGLWNWSLMLITIVAIITLMVNRFMQRHLVVPLASLSNVVDKVRQGDLQAKVPEGASGELLMLQQGVNVMIDALADMHGHMQQEIETATESLRQALQDIELRNRDLHEERLKAETASLAKSQFLATMSHEIRTPLGGMIGMLHVIRHGISDRQQLDCIDSVEAAANSLRQLIDDILDFSRMEVGKLTLQNQLFNPLSVIEDVMRMFAPSAQQKNLHFVLNVDGTLPHEVVGDPLRFRQILINLTANAIKFTHQGEVVVSAGAVKRDTQRTVRFEVCDTGIGIAAEKQELVFESFTQIDEGDARHYGGSGLGTTVSRELVTMMGGDIGLESELGKGSCFWFELPWEAEESQPESTEAANVLLMEPHESSARAIAAMLESEQIGVTRVTTITQMELALRDRVFDWVMVGVFVHETTNRQLLNQLDQELPDATRLVHLCYVNGERQEGGRIEHLSKPVLPSVLHQLLQHGGGQVDEDETDKVKDLVVLLAEDDEVNARVITHFLTTGGHRVVRVVNGAEALKVMEDHHFDCVLMDMRMPGMDGLEATRLWRSKEGGDSHLPIIALTANASDEDRERCREVGMDDYLTKPVESQRLLETLVHYCR
ncbi:MAG: response regulator [Chromatiales bacterium]|nr:response regulator [Chromatiales bacterium]